MAPRHRTPRAAAAAPSSGSQASSPPAGSRERRPADGLPDTRASGDRAELDEVESLVGDWDYVPDVAARYGIALSRVRRQLADRELIALRVGPNRAWAVPQRFLGASGPRPELKGTFTVLADGGMNDVQIVRWLFTPDETLPVPGAPIDALVAGHKTEVRRRAQALAF